MKKNINLLSGFVCANKVNKYLAGCSILVCVTFMAAAQEFNEPKQLQKLYKCLDTNIVKLSKKKEKANTSSVLLKCDEKLSKWLEILPEESHEQFKTQLTESITQALLDAENGLFIADEH